MTTRAKRHAKRRRSLVSAAPDFRRRPYWIGLTERQLLQLAQGAVSAGVQQLAQRAYLPAFLKGRA